MDHLRDHDHCRGYQIDREYNQQSASRQNSYRGERQRAVEPCVVRTAPNQDDSIERQHRVRSSGRRSADEPVVHADDPSARRVGRPPCPRNRILLVHGLDRVPVNCDRVFNLFCLYGNVAAVKVLLGDKALVEMADEPAAERCVSNLHLLPLDDSGEWRLKVKYSKHYFLYDQVVFNTLWDDTPVQKDYSKSLLNRFTETSSHQDRRRITKPSKILHFFNAPIDVCGYAVHKAVTDALGVADAIRSITILPKQPAAKCSTGLIEFKTVALAAKTILLSNHMPLTSKRSRFPFRTKLCFSKWSEIGPVTEPGAVSSSLRLSYASGSPWLLHESERADSATTFQIERTTTVTGCCGDCPWTLWTVRHGDTFVPDDDHDLDEHNRDDRDDNDGGGGYDDDGPAITSDVRSDVRSELFAMLRLRLCLRDDRGDVPHGEPSPGASDAAARLSVDAAVQVSGGPLGDA